MVGDSLDKILGELTLTPEEFAQSIGVTKGAIYKLLQGNTKKITTTMAKKIWEKYPQYSVQYLLSWNRKYTNGDNIEKRLSNSIVLDDELINRKDELHSLTFYLNDNLDELSKDRVFKIFLDRVAAEVRAVLKSQMAKEYDKLSEQEKEEIQQKYKDTSKMNR